jgi:hypothetical protein
MEDLQHRRGQVGQLNRHGLTMIDANDCQLTGFGRPPNRFERLFFLCLLVFTARYDFFVLIHSRWRDISRRGYIGIRSGQRTTMGGSSSDHCRTESSSGAVGSDDGGLQASKDSTLKALKRAWCTSTATPTMGGWMKTRRVLRRLGLKSKSKAGGYLYGGGRGENVGGVRDRALSGKSESFLKVCRFSASRGFIC